MDAQILYNYILYSGAKYLWVPSMVSASCHCCGT